MAKLTLEFKTDNAAFTDGNGEAEIARILRTLASRIEDGGRDDMHILVSDLNGNAIGHCYFTLPEPESD